MITPIWKEKIDMGLFGKKGLFDSNRTDENKLLRLAFHDCIPYAKPPYGGCDGCLNWDGMDFLNEIPRGNMAFTFKVWPSYRTQPVTKKTNNNKLSTTVFALEWLYRVPNWPPGAPELPQSLWSSGWSKS